MTSRSLCMVRGMRAGLLCAGLVLAGCRSAPVLPSKQEIRIATDVVLYPLAEGVWVHTTYRDLPDYGRVPANGLLVIGGTEAMLIDLPWTDEQTAVLFDWAAARGAAVRTVVPTHFHEDCMGGLAEAHRRGAVSYGLDKTIDLARRERLPIPRIPYQARVPIRSGRTIALVTYYGAGHTTDNVVAWLPKQRVLFGGCLIRSLDSPSLGNTSDGDLVAYPATLRKVRAACPGVRIVVPGHGDWGGPELIDHTLELCSPKGR